MGRMAAALRRLGFDAVYDTDFAADLTIVEEATEFIERVKNGGVLPMIIRIKVMAIMTCAMIRFVAIKNPSRYSSSQLQLSLIAFTLSLGRVSTVRLKISGRA